MMLASKPRWEPNWKKKPDQLLKFLTTRSRGRLVAWIAALYALPIFSFAVLYEWQDLLRDNGSPIQNYGQALFFSLIIQASGGFLDITTTGVFGRSLVAAQILIGVSWAAFLPAIILIRLTNPDTRSLYFADKMAFNPDSGQFAIRYASFSRLLIFNTHLTVWARVLAPKSQDWNNLPVQVRSSIESNRRFGNIRPGIAFIVYTDPSPNRFIKRRRAEFPEDIKEVFLDPEHLKGFETQQRKNEAIVTIDIAGGTSAGTVHAFHEYRYDDIICGYPIPVQDDPDGPKNWENFNRFYDTTKLPNGNKKCLGCPHHATCGLVNKYKGAP
ncbi:hypothetical protein [Pseudarthrobacter sp. BRE9]|uniref:hypothetical protein n=1 Tax=Pseudarthrobacter sp. BRE9 TaxID=2962582 RepID=UPI0028816714|nr:hypothetical protein [Pseudarthrobacter sp. BRE9]MDT0168451.1 hypothetical protein [Pseudarthrobacter sp. BRE9]